MVPEDREIDEGAETMSLHLRARRAIRLLVGRQILLQLLALIGGIVVARILGPGPIGVFGISLFVIYLASLVTDLGTRIALIRQAESPSDTQLATCFTMQLLLVTLVVALLQVFAPGLASLYPNAPVELDDVIRLLSFDLYLRSWRSMSEIRLERDLRYRQLALADVAGSAGYQTVSVALVLGGLGAHALAWAILAGNLVRITILYRAARWPIRFTLHRTHVQNLVRAGIPLQANQIVTQAPAWITPTLVAGLIGPEAVGLLTWASTLGRKPREMLENVVRVALPHFARLQSNVRELKRVLLRYANLSMLACGLWVAVIAVAGRDLIEVIYTDRWLPALPALIIYSAAALPGSVRGLASAALIGIGRVRYAARISAIAALVSVACSICLVLAIGFLGVPLGQTAGTLVATPLLIKGLRVGAARSMLTQAHRFIVPLVLAIAIGGLTLLLQLTNPLRALVVGMTVGLIYLAIAWRTSPPWLRGLAREEVGAVWIRLFRSPVRPVSNEINQGQP